MKKDFVIPENFVYIFLGFILGVDPILGHNSDAEFESFNEKLFLGILESLEKAM